MIRIAIIVSFFCFANAQNINLYLTLIQKGRYSEVKENLPDLLSRYPNEAGVFFIQALIYFSFALLALLSFGIIVWRILK